MQKEYFKILKEISSLISKKQELEKHINDELKRILFIKDQRQKRSSLLEEKINEKALISKEEVKIENELSSLQKSLDQAKGNINSIVDVNQEKALLSQISNLEEKINVLEEKGFLLLESLDLCNEDIKNAQNFLDGSLISLNEIEQEVNKINLENNHQIEITQSRIEALKEELPPKFNDAIDSALKKKIANSIFTRINQSKCDICKLGLSKVEEDSVEKKMELLTCSGCKRIFIPENSLY